MRKLILLFVGLCITALPSSAAMNFYRSANGQIVAEATNCQDVSRLLDLVGIPDDPPGGNAGTAVTEGQESPTGQGTAEAAPEGDNDIPAEPNAGLTDEEKAARNQQLRQGTETLARAILGPDAPYTPKGAHGISKNVEDLLDAADFEERQDSFVTFVRDVNWKTGLQITFRDFSFFRRLRMACSGINQLSKPFRVNFGAWTDGVDQTVETAADAGVNQLAKAARAHSFNAMSKLSVIGLAIAIEKENPFLLLALDEETYLKVIEVEPRVATLFEDMYTFFKIRSVRMGEFSANIKALIDVSKIGKGDSFHTWHTMAQYALKMLELDRQGKLNPEDERDIHIWRLENSMRYIKEHVGVEKRAAEIAAKDPHNAALVTQVLAGPKKKLSLDDKAIELLRRSTQAEIKHMIQKHIAK